MKHTMRPVATALLLACTLIAPAAAQATTTMPAIAPSAADLANIREAKTIAQTVGDRLWAGWSRTPFVIDLLTQSDEIVLNAPAVPPGFTRLPDGTAYRKRTFPPNLEASFPAFGKETVIVIGEPRFTQAKTPTRWTVTVLHEHFHQWQMSWPNYGRDVRALGLAHGDTTGMWMLNYAFPYASPRVRAQFSGLTTRLSAAVRARGTPRFGPALRAYLARRAAWRSSLKADDYRYFAFQCWQEGVARYTEYRIAQLAARAHAADPGFLSATQSRLLAQDSRRTYTRVLDHIDHDSLEHVQRNVFYAVGAGEAMLLDEARPGWRRRYLDPRMDLGAFF